jgi:hypothetical protein
MLALHAGLSVQFALGATDIRRGFGGLFDAACWTHARR